MIAQALRHVASDSVTPRVEGLVRRLREVVTVRDDALFTRFLPAGYELITLDSVSPVLRDDVLIAKVRVGTLITVYDDFADHPALLDPELLEKLYELPRRLPAPGETHPVVTLAAELWSDVQRTLDKLPHHGALRRVLDFDIDQFYAANRYSELVSAQPSLANQVETEAYAPHNMGILVVGTLDLMASPGYQPKELGRIRAFLHRAQRLSRICNVLSTRERELREGDVTSAAEVDGVLLKTEREAIYSELGDRARGIRSFDARRYVEGLRGVQSLHEAMEGVI